MPFQPTFSNSDLISFFKDNYGSEVQLSSNQRSSNSFQSSSSEHLKKNEEDA